MSDDIEKEYQRVKKLVYCKLIAISAVFSAVLSVLIFKLAFNGYNVPKNRIFSLTLPFPINVLEAIVVATFCIFVGLVLLFGKSMIKKKIGKNYAGEAAKIFDDEAKKFLESSKKTVVAIVFIVVGIVGLCVLSVHNVGINENEIRFSDSHTIVIVTKNVSEFKLYKVEGHYEDGATILYNDKAYGIVSDDGKSYDFGIVSDEFEDYLLDMFHHNYEEAESIDEVLAQRNRRGY